MYFENVSFMVVYLSVQEDRTKCGLEKLLYKVLVIGVI